MTTMTTTDTNAADSILADERRNGPKAPDAAAKARAKARAKSGTTGSLAAHSTADALGIIREWGKVYSLAATKCAMCGKSLRDSVSVTRGIGPDCSRQHYDVSFDITDSMVEDALGHLFASGLDSKVKSAAKALKSKPRDLCNVLVWWASAHLGETDTVIAIANIVTSLGFDSLGGVVTKFVMVVLFGVVLGVVWAYVAPPKGGGAPPAAMEDPEPPAAPEEE